MLDLLKGINEKGIEQKESSVPKVVAFHSKVSLVNTANFNMVY